MKFLLSITVLFFSACSMISVPDHIKQLQKAPVPKIVLRLDPNGHTGDILDMIVTEDKSELITAGFDKTVRVWDIKTGKEKRKILGEIGVSVLGSIYAIALSKNDKYLAVAGFSIKNAGMIKIYDYKSGKIVKILNTDTEDMIYALAFSQDGKFLISEEGSGMSRIWDVTNDFSLYDTMQTAYETIEAVDIIIKNNKHFVVAASHPGRLSMYNIEKKTEIKQRYLHQDVFNYDFLATTDSYGGNIAVVNKLSRIYSKVKKDVEKNVWIFDYNFNLIKTIDNQEIPAAIAYSDDGKYLLVGSKSLPVTVSVYDASNNYKKVTSFSKHNNRNGAVTFLDNKTAITAGGNANEIYFWDVKTAKVKQLIKSNGQGVWRVGIKGDKIAWGNIQHTPKTGLITPLQYSMDLKTHTISKEVENFTPLSKKNGDYSLESNAKKNLYPSTILVKKNNKGISFITRNATNGLVHISYGWYKDYVISAGAGGTLYVYNKKGEIVTTLAGHIDEIWSIDIDGDRLISGGADMTMKIWDLSKVGKQKVIKPLVNIFVGDDKSWTMWTEEGYFTQSSNSAKNIYFHLNRGPFKEATAVGIDKLYDHFFRPDLVKLKLQGEDIGKYTHGLTYKDVLKDPPPSVKIAKVKKSDIDTKKRTATIHFSVKENDNGGVGSIRIYQEGKLVKIIGKKEVKRQRANADIQIEDAQLDKLSKIKQKEFLAQADAAASKAVQGDIDLTDSIGSVSIENINNKSGTYSVTLPIKAGFNDISIEAYNKSTTVASYRERVVVKAKMKKITPKIYAIVAGVNEFEHGNVQNLKYSENDAKVMAREIKNATRYKTEVTLLLGKKVTKENIIAAIKKIQKKAHLEDKILFYISTHGKAVKGKLYLAPQNNKRLSNWINFTEVFQEIQSVSALSQIFVIDACESGKASDILGAVYDAKASVLAKQSGAHLLMATTSGTYAFENDQAKHGAFTYNILQALHDKNTDKNRNKKISIVELSTVLKEPKYTEEHQFPVIRNIGADTYIKKVKR